MTPEELQNGNFIEEEHPDGMHYFEPQNYPEEKIEVGRLGWNELGDGDDDEYDEGEDDEDDDRNEDTDDSDNKKEEKDKEDENEKDEESAEGEPEEGTEGTEAGEAGTEGAEAEEAGTEAAELTEATEAAEGAEAAVAAAEGAEAAEAAEAAIAIAAAPEEGAAIGIIGAVVAAVVVVVIMVVFIMALMGAKPDEASAVTTDKETKSIICIDPGHPSEYKGSDEQTEYDQDAASWMKNKTGATAGTSGNGSVERVINQQVADALTAELNDRGYDAIETKTSADKFMSNRARGQFCRDKKAELIIKIHNDGSTGFHGMEFFTSNGTYIKNNWDQQAPDTKEYLIRRKDSVITDDQKIGKQMKKAFEDGQAKYNFKYKSESKPHPTNAGFGYTYNIPTSLFEMSNMADANNVKFISSTSNQKKIVKAFADGIEKYIPPTTGGTGSNVGLCKTLPKPDDSSKADFAKLPNKGPGFDGVSGEGFWGAPEMIALLEAVSAEWDKKHPKITVQINDISLKNGGSYNPPHASHQKGIDVDLNSNSNNPNFIMAHAPYDPDLAIELGKMLIDTKSMVFIWYNDVKVQKAVNAYAKKKNLPGRMETLSGHANHFHVRMDPSAYAKACGFTESSAGKKGDAWLKTLGQDGG